MQRFKTLERLGKTLASLRAMGCYILWTSAHEVFISIQVCPSTLALQSYLTAIIVANGFAGLQKNMPVKIKLACN